MGNESAVIVAGLAAGGFTLGNDFAANGPRAEQARIVFGTFLLIAVLLLIAEWWPEGAKGLASVILVTAIVLNGGPFFRLLGRIVGSDRSPAQFGARAQ